MFLLDDDFRHVCRHPTTSSRRCAPLRGRSRSLSLALFSPLLGSLILHFGTILALLLLFLLLPTLSAGARYFVGLFATIIFEA